MSYVTMIAGATGGIGSSLALELSKRGHDLVLIGKNKNKLINLQKELQSNYTSKSSIYTYVIDFDNPQEKIIAKLFDDVFNRFNKIDFLVNTIGLCAWYKIEDFSLSFWNKILSINLTSSFLLNKYSVMYMKKRKKGTIVNISSIASLKGAPYSSAYCAAKAGVNALSRSLAKEVGKEGIRVILLILDGVNTEFINKCLEISDVNLYNYIYKKYKNSENKINQNELARFIANIMESDDNISYKEIILEVM